MTLKVTASGALLDGVAPLVEVRVNGSLVGMIDVQETVSNVTDGVIQWNGPVTYTFELAGGTPVQELRLAQINHEGRGTYAHRNFYVHALELDGVKLSPAGMLYDAAGKALQSTQAIYLSGYLQMDATPYNNLVAVSASDDDSISGGSGHDVAVYENPASDYTLTLGASQILLKNTKGSLGMDALQDVEGIRFADKTISIASRAHGSYADLPVGLYQFFITAFNAAPGVAYMDQLAEAWRYGLSLKQIVDIFVSKPQFTDMYPASLTHAQLATSLVDQIVKTSASTAAKAQAVENIRQCLDIGWTVGDVIYQVFGNLANKPWTDTSWGNTAKQLANEITVARTYTETLNQSTADLGMLRSVMAPVTAQSDVSSTELQVTLIGLGLLGH